MVYVVSMAGCGNSDTEVPVIRTDDQYDTVMKQVQSLTQTTLQKPDDASLTPKEDHDLRLAAIKVKGLIGYKPDLYSNYLLAGKVSFFLQDYPTAQVYFYQCLEQSWKSDEDKAFYLQSFAEAHYMLSKCLFLQNQYQQAADQAMLAVQLEPESDLYRLAEAEAEEQLHHDTTALGILLDANRINPKNQRVLELVSQILRTNPEAAKKLKGKIEAAKKSGALSPPTHVDIR